MGIDVSRATSQAHKINEYAAQLRDTQNALNNYKANLNSAWQAEEMIYVNRAIDNINSEINNLSSTLDSLGNDIVTTANEIRREEEERERAAAAANAK
jgi:uncharacterized protein YukE